MATNLSSSSQWRRVLSSNSIVITDFYADWCGPCKMIAPTFESLATKYSKPGKIAFYKVNVDNHNEVSSAHNVRAMPTFMIFHNGTAIDTIQGANPPALTAAVEKAIKLAGAGVATGAGFGTPGRTLGGSGIGGAGGSQRNSLARPWRWDLNKFINALFVFFGLYFTSLLSLDPYKAAENSTFNKNRPPPPSAQIKTPGQKAAPAKPTFKTMADL